MSASMTGQLPDLPEGLFVRSCLDWSGANVICVLEHPDGTLYRWSEPGERDQLLAAGLVTCRPCQHCGGPRDHWPTGTSWHHVQEMIEAGHCPACGNPPTRGPS